MPREAADQMAAQVAQNAAIAQPIPKAGLPEDIAAAALYLASDDSAFVTGTHLIVDGGITIGGRHAWDSPRPRPFAQIFGLDAKALQERADLAHVNHLLPRGRGFEGRAL